ncbi:MAG: tRNA (N(6)-L-threonylcarbamoyladenosine(37)-C(2))-methylthiotransferase MtaB [Candidatus Omnitrophota bacterium]
MQTVKFYTLGCKVNQYDTQNLRERFEEAGFKELEDTEAADVCVVNTCTVTHKADADSLNIIRKTRRQNPKARIIVTGCLTELDEKKIKDAGARLIIKNKDKTRITEILNRQMGKSFGRLRTLRRRALSEREVPANRQMYKGISFFKGHTRAFIKIQDGCDNFCSYCKVPLVRGASRSRPLKDVVEEANRLSQNGFREIVLTGICLGSYGRDLKQRVSLVNVIDKLEDIDEQLRIRLSSIEAGDISDGLIHKLAHSRKLCRHLHVPFQSGDNEILKKMNRRDTFEDYLRLIRRIKAAIPEIAITTDIIVGFPSETEENFQNTLSLIKQTMPLRVHIFTYSLREPTAASNFKENCNPVIVKKRVSKLKEISQNCSLIFKKRFLNRKMEVLIEGRAKENKDYWQGYTGNYMKVEVKSELDLKNKMVPLQLKKIFNSHILADFY